MYKYDCMGATSLVNYVRIEMPNVILNHGKKHMTNYMIRIFHIANKFSIHRPHTSSKYVEAV